MITREDNVARFVREHGLAPEAAVALRRMLAEAVATSDTLAGPASEPFPSLADGRAPAPPAEDRYEVISILGRGGMGEVRLVRDRVLRRRLAQKVIRQELCTRAPVVARFVEEAEVSAQLEHPGIVPVHDFGRLPDGRQFFTMKEVRGRTLTAILQKEQWPLPRLIAAFASVCEAIGYAHARGVVHRDLKPDNVMVGDHGEVLVLDWGIAKLLGRTEAAEADEAVWSGRASDESLATRMGSVAGTPTYMPPEQARGEIHRIAPTADVYALGAMLYQILSGRPPYEGRDARVVLAAVLAGPPPPPGRVGRLDVTATMTLSLEELGATEEGPGLPPELVDLCERCMAREPEDRPKDGAAVAHEVRSWLEGAQQRERALALVEKAGAMQRTAAALRDDAQRRHNQGEAILRKVPPHAGEEEKAEGWACLDEARRLLRDAITQEEAAEATFEAALLHAPTLPEAHLALAERLQATHGAAELRKDSDTAVRSELRLRTHVEALTGADRERFVTWLRGTGKLSLRTSPPGASATLWRHVEHNRRQHREFVRDLGTTPLVDLSLEMGSYIIELRKDGHHPVRYPVRIGRGEHWQGAPPGRWETQAIDLPPLGALDEGEVYVPAGWFQAGGDPEARDTLPRLRLWADAFVVDREPVTNTRYLAFVNDLLAQGREEEALACCPRERAGAVGEGGAPIYGRAPDGTFILVPDADGDQWHPDWPVFLVDWMAATAYARWLADRTGRPYQLLPELWWEKAARGVDGRFFPMGDHGDPSWFCVGPSHDGRPLPQPVSAFPVDESPYGVRGLAGGVATWCLDAFQRSRTDLASLRVPNPGPTAPEQIDPHLPRVQRGGHWLSTLTLARSAARVGFPGHSRDVIMGFRLCRPWPRR